MKLAINGGSKVMPELFPAQITIGEEEKEAVRKVLDSELLSGYRGNASKAFYGGEYVRKLEKKFKSFMYTGEINRGTVAVNSCTSALQIACGAIGLEPGDEVIVTPWSMSCSATAPMVYGATPVFADIEREYFCLDPNSIKEKITDRTKAIIVVDLFGQPYDVKEINKIAKANDLFIIEDAAQAIGSQYGIEKAGSFGDIGCFSFTQGKHLTAGEGGMLVSQDEEFLLKSQLIRNHAEAVINDMDPISQEECLSHKNMFGFNMRMTEIQAAILIHQLNKLPDFIANRRNNAFCLNTKLSEIPCIEPVKERKGCFHSYYALPFYFDSEKCDGIHRDKFIEAVKAELTGEEKRIDKGVAIGCGYIKPLYLMPLFTYNLHWTLEQNSYNVGDCPVAEKLWRDDLFVTVLHGLPLEGSDRQKIVDAFIKVYENREELK